MTILTSDLIIKHVLDDLDPAFATKLTNGDQAAKATTKVYEAIQTTHGVIELEYRTNRTGARQYVAIYVRVSTEKQLEDGYSAGEQLRRAIAYCIQHKLAFRIFSDVWLSGGLAINEAPLIAELQRAKARRYQKVFDRILLPDTHDWSESQVASAIAFRDRQIK